MAGKQYPMSLPEDLLNKLTLYPHGIQNCEADYMIHVCFNAKHVYVYSVENGMAAIWSGRYEFKRVYIRRHRQRIPTGEGCLVRPENIEGCKWAKIPRDVLDSSRIGGAQDPSEKGRAAEFTASEMIERGVISFPSVVQAVADKDDQLRGLNGAVVSRPTWQTKCDLPGGHKEFGGTGNLFVQVAEINLDGYH